MKTNLKQLRKQAGWSNAEDFAKSINMPVKTYRNYEQGVRNMGLDVASEICNALGCSLNELTGFVKYAVVELPRDDPMTSSEREVVELFRQLDKHRQERVLEGIRDYVLATKSETD